MVQATVAAIITKSDGNTKSVLLARRNSEPYKGFWSIPGGHIEPYETAENAVIREIKEEIGTDFEPRFFAYFDEIIPEKDIHAVVIVFTGIARGQPNLCAKEIAEIVWLPLSEAQSLPLAFLQNKVLDLYVDGVSQGDADE